MEQGSQDHWLVKLTTIEAGFWLLVVVLVLIALASRALFLAWR
jgi:hypothetical protein